jgi:hypothetical protein
MIIKYSFMLIGFLCASLGFAQERIKPIHDFFTSRLQNNTFRSSKNEFVLEAGKLVGVSQYTKSFVNVSLKDRNFIFEESVKKMQTNYRLDDQGNKILPGEEHNSPGFVTRCIFNERISAPRVLGFCFNEDDAGWEMSGELKFEDDVLIMDLATATEFSDGYSAVTSSGWKPIKQSLIYHFKYDGTAVSFMTREIGYNYEPQTGVMGNTPYASIEKTYTSESGAITYEGALRP